MRVDSVGDIGAVQGYLKRIGAEVRSLRTAVVKEQRGNYWRDIAVIRFEKNGEVNAPEGWEPTDLEAAQIKAEFANVVWPTIKLVKLTDHLPSEIETAAPENVYEFRDHEGNLVMMQLRKTKRDGGKAYIPFTLWDDDVWRKIEPDGQLPLWGMENISRSTTAFIHEGAKAARAMQRLIDARTPEEKAVLAAHPWGEELSNAVHLGWIGGALTPHRTDWSQLKKHGIKRAYIVSDNDTPGRSAVPAIAYHIDLPAFHVQVTNEWPASFDLADDFPDKMFSVIEGNRYYIGPTFRSCVHPATWATDLNANKKGKPTPILRDHFKELWAYVEESDLFVCIEMPEIIRSENVLNKTLSAFSHTPDTCKLLMKAYHGRSTKLCYRPDIKGRIVTDRTTSAVNLHTGTQVKFLKGSAEPWVEFLNYLVPNDTERHELMRWCATLIARPDLRMEYGILAVSEHQGVGKTTLASAILAPLVGFQNVGHPTESDIVHSDFNEWLANKRLVVVNEIYSGHSWKAYNRLKSYITDRELTVNIKFQRPYTIENWAHIFACSNSLRALKMEEDDRRWYYPELTEVTWSREKFTSFHNWLRSGGLGIIRSWAEGFGDWVFPGQRAPMTLRKKELIEGSRSEAQREAVELMREANLRQDSVALAMKEVKNWLQANVRGEIFDSDLELRKAMREAGGRPFKERLAIGGRMQYVVMNDALWRVVANKQGDEAIAAIRGALQAPAKIINQTI